MTRDEITATYNELMHTLAENGLTWVLDEVDAMVRRGNEVEKPTRILRDEAEGAVREAFGAYADARRSGKATLLMTREPWPEDDRLLFLIDGVRQAIVRAAEIEKEGLRLIQNFGEVTNVSFEPEDDRVASNNRALRLTDVQDENVRKLATLLDELADQVRS